ncbi:hypothetical protein, partial [Flaviaesturariibacter amylovorans]|uniref:hypothetical protein n=1 Tax=Flaviaesturariibacter amylovorans TaxID=1084520 RepID=UPI0031F194EA
MKTSFFSIAILLSSTGATAQDTTSQTLLGDTITPKTKYLSEITVVGRGSRSDYQALPEIVGTNIYAGKKNALIVLDNV